MTTPPVIKAPLKLRIKNTVKESEATQWVVAFLIASYMTLVRLTSRVIYLDRDDMLKRHQGGESLIFTLWHGRLLAMPYIFPKKVAISALISAHKDGRLISKVARFFKKETVTGSSSSGGAAAIRDMVRRIKRGDIVFITPDGPKGPRMHFQHGAVEVARLTGATVIPVAATFKHAKVFKSWDRFAVPRLFNTIIIQYGTGMDVKDKSQREQVALSLEMEMNDIQQAIDAQYATFPAVAPARKDVA